MNTAIAWAGWWAFCCAAPTSDIWQSLAAVFGRSFGRSIAALTPMQFAALARLAEAGAQSQNALGRQTAMDAATIKGVIDRLGRRGLVTTALDAQERETFLALLKKLT